MNKILLAILATVLAVFSLSCTKVQAPAARKKLTIAVIPKGTTHEFWKSIHAGSNKAAQELTAQGEQIDVIWKGPLREDDREQQIQVIEGFAAQGVSGIVLAPLDNHALVRPVEDAKRAGVPTVMVFVQSLRGLSHTKLEDTKPEHLELSVAALDRLLEANIAAGMLRPDLDAGDVILALAGLWQLDPNGDWKAQAQRIYDIVLGGLQVS